MSEIRIGGWNFNIGITQVRNSVGDLWGYAIHLKSTEIFQVRGNAEYALRKLEARLTEKKGGEKR